LNQYSEERKSAVLKKLLPPLNRSVASVSREEGITEVTLYHWRKQARNRGEVVPGNKPLSDDWPAEARLAVVIATSTLSEVETATYCREKGLYVEQVATWRQACLDGQALSVQQQAVVREQARSDKKRIRELERELLRKDKALAETAALLVLRKKLNALWENDDEVN
jgi:transposase-like protein